MITCYDLPNKTPTTAEVREVLAAAGWPAGRTRYAATDLYRLIYREAVIEAERHRKRQDSYGIHVELDGQVIRLPAAGWYQDARARKLEMGVSTLRRYVRRFEEVGLIVSLQCVSPDRGRGGTVMVHAILPREIEVVVDAAGRPVKRRSVSNHGRTFPVLLAKRRALEVSGCGYPETLSLSGPSARNERLHPTKMSVSLSTTDPLYRSSLPNISRAARGELRAENPKTREALLADARRAMPANAGIANLETDLTGVEPSTTSRPATDNLEGLPVRVADIGHGPEQRVAAALRAKMQKPTTDAVITAWRLGMDEAGGDPVCPWGIGKIKMWLSICRRDPALADKAALILYNTLANWPAFARFCAAKGEWRTVALDTAADYLQSDGGRAFMIAFWRDDAGTQASPAAAETDDWLTGTSLRAKRAASARRGG